MWGITDLGQYAGVCGNAQKFKLRTISQVLIVVF